MYRSSPTGGRCIPSPPGMALQTITAAQPFSLTGRHHELRRKGCHSFVIDLRQAGREQWGEIIGAFKASRPLADTTEFNYTGGPRVGDYS